MNFFLVFVCVVAPALSISSEMDIWNLMTEDDSVWKCITELNEECVKSLGKRPIEELFKAPELKLGRHVFIEKISNSSEEEQRAVLQDFGNLQPMMDAAIMYLKNHALKLKFGNFEGKIFKSPDKADSLELTVEARKKGTGKSQRIYRVILPLIVGFKITGLVIFSIVSVKMFLLKTAFVANSALLVAGGIVLKKLYDHGMGMLTKHQAFLNSNYPLPNYYANNHDFSGYGYNNFVGNGFDGGVQSEVGDPVLGDVPDLHGQFSHHAIALAALNKTLMQQQQQQQQQQTSPKRRWGHKWSPWHSSR